MYISECYGPPPQSQQPQLLLQWEGSVSIGASASYRCNNSQLLGAATDDDVINVTCQDPGGWTPASAPVCISKSLFLSQILHIFSASSIMRYFENKYDISY
jgi:hypothetical protein